MFEKHSSWGTGLGRVLLTTVTAAALTAASVGMTTVGAQAAVGDCPTTEADLSSLIDAAGDGGDVSFSCEADTTISFSSAIVISASVTLDASSSPGKVVLDGGGTTQLFDIAATGALTLDTLTVRKGFNGATRGGAIHNAGTLTVTDSTFTGNVNNGCSTCRPVPAADFRGARGGAIDNDGGTLTVVGSTFTDNQVMVGNDGSKMIASEGGAIGNFGGTATIEHSTFTGNSATGNLRGWYGTLGGGAVSGAEGTTSIRGSTFTGNSVAGSLDGTQSAALGGAVSGIDGTVTISGSTFTENSVTNDTASLAGGRLGAGGAVGVRQGTMEVAGCTFTSNRATHLHFQAIGGAGAAVFDGELTVRNSTFTDSYAEGKGKTLGSFNVDSSTNKVPITLDGVTISSNPGGDFDNDFFGSDIGTINTLPPKVTNTTFVRSSADSTYPVFLLERGPGGTLMLDGAHFSGYHTRGGLIQIIPKFGGADPTQVAISNSSFTDNTSDGNGGAISILGGTITNSTFENNTASGSGGAIYSAGSPLTITGSTFTGNVAADSSTENATGGGAVFSDRLLNVSDSTFVGNSATPATPSQGLGRPFAGGGAILARGGLQAVRSTFTGNSATAGGRPSNGGAITLIGDGAIADSVLNDNTSYAGGAIAAGYSVGFQRADLSVTNTTIAGNNGGGAIYSEASTVSVTASTVVDNTGGPFAAYNPGLVFSWTIGASIVQAVSCDPFASESSVYIISKGYNFSDGPNWCNGIAPTAADIFGVADLKLDAAGLADNGGPTKTIALRADSRAVGAIPASSGMCQAADQRGATRANGTDPACDIGAFESPTVAIAAAGSQTYGSDKPAFTYDDEVVTGTVTGAPPVKISGTLVCTTVDSGVPIGATLAAGLHTLDSASCSGLTASGGRVEYFPVVGGFTVGAAPQSITFTSTPPATATAGATYTVSATGGGSGKPVVFSIDAGSTAGACTIDGSTVTFGTPGNCVIDADQAGDDDYSQAPTASQTITVTLALTSVSVSPDPASVPAGKTVQFTATGHYSDGTSAALTSGVAWSSSDEASAKVDATSGIATGLVSGKSVHVTATVGGITGSATLRVTDPVLTGLTVAPSTLSLAKGLTGTLTATGTYSDGTTQDLTGSADWSTSATSVATVSHGTVTAIGTGSATITAKAGGSTATAAVTVTAATIKSLAITPSPAKLAKGTSVPLVATATFTDGTTAIVTSAAHWSSSATGVATVSATGTVTGITVGTATITAADGSATATATATVTAATLRSIAVTPARPSAALGKTVAFTATGTFSDGSRQDITTQVAWRSSAARVVTVDDAGTAQTHAKGSTTISGTLLDVSGSTKLTVTAPALTGVAVVPGTISVAKGLQFGVTVRGIYTDGSVRDVTRSATIASSKPAVASVSGATVTARAQGTATLTAKVGGLAATAAVTVTPPELLTIRVKPIATTVAKGKTVALQATGLYTDRSTANLTAAVAWASSSTRVAKVSAAGVVTGVSTGVAAVTATMQGLKGVATVLVTPR